MFKQFDGLTLTPRGHLVIETATYVLPVIGFGAFIYTMILGLAVIGA